MQPRFLSPQEKHKHCIFMECPHCGWVASKVELRRHFREMGNEHNIYCVQCSHMIRTYSEYVQHIELDHGGVWKYHCGWCIDRFDSQEELKEHMEVDTHLKFGACKGCGLTFPNLQDHYRRVHGKKKFKCPECIDAQYSTIKEYEYHRKYKHSFKYSCEFCGMVFGKPFALKTHILTNHTEEKDKPHQCRFCAKGFLTRSKLITHENIHQNIRPHSCPQCGASFVAKYNLMAHMKMHDPTAKFAQKGPRKKVRSYEKYLEEHGIQKQAPKAIFCKLCNSAYTGSHTNCAGLGGQGKKGGGARSKGAVKAVVDLPMCTLCDEEFESADALRDHVAQHHIPGVRMMT